MHQMNKITTKNKLQPKDNNFIFTWRLLWWSFIFCYRKVHSSSLPSSKWDKGKGTWTRGGFCSPAGTAGIVNNEEIWNRSQNKRCSGTDDKSGDKDTVSLNYSTEKIKITKKSVQVNFSLIPQQQPWCWEAGGLIFLFLREVQNQEFTEFSRWTANKINKMWTHHRNPPKI